MTACLAPVVERHRDLAEVHLGPTEHDLAGDPSDGESRAKIALGRAKLAAHSEAGSRATAASRRSRRDRRQTSSAQSPDRTALRRSPGA